MLDSRIQQRARRPQARHWSPQQSYVTGDVLVSLLAEGWHIRHIQATTPESRVRLYDCTLDHDGEQLLVRVLDGPAVREAASTLIPTHSIA